MYRERIPALRQVTALPLVLREEMAKEGGRIRLPEIVRSFHSADGTERYLIAGEDGRTVETVWMPAGDGGEAQGEAAGAGERAEYRRATICVSSQIGCAVMCRFCLTAKLGLQRDLSAGEIAGQVIAVMDRHGIRAARDRVNLVFMGMGEPFLNYEAFMAAVRLLATEAGLSDQRMTVSTSGIAPGIERFAAETIRPRLAISLNAPNDKIREAIMPVNRKWKIEDILAAAAKIPLRPRERVTLEYVLLSGVNDGPEHAAELARLARRCPMPVKVNLIAWNPGPEMEYATPAEDQVAAFRRILRDRGVAVYVRRPRGRDIFAACGQLKRTTE
jgi:23S rRNA (adenine2503-C2)-methyltransferase